jgi:hypothetical protein
MKRRNHDMKDRTVSRAMKRAMLRSIAAYLLVILIAAGVLGLIFISPLALRGLVSVRGFDWSRLSDIGQTYGAASAILSALAFGGIAVSIFIQIRQAKTQEIQATYGFYFDLMRITLEDPETYAPCWGPMLCKQTRRDIRRHLLVNQIWHYLLAAHKTDTLSKDAIFRGLRNQFEGEVPRDVWRRIGDGWKNPGMDRDTASFVDIVDREYRSTLEEGIPPVPFVLAEEPNQVQASIDRATNNWNLVAGVVAGIAGGLLVGVALRRRKP